MKIEIAPLLKNGDGEIYLVRRKNGKIEKESILIDGEEIEEEIEIILKRVRDYFWK